MGNRTLSFPKRGAILSSLRRSARILAALNTPPAEHVPCRDVKSSLGTAFYALRAGKRHAALPEERSYPCCLEFYDLP